MENCQDYVSHEMIIWMEIIRKCDITTQKIHAVSKTKQATDSNLLHWKVSLPMEGGLKWDDLQGPFLSTPLYDSVVLILFKTYWT